MLLQKLEDLMFQKGAPQGIRHLARPDLHHPNAALKPLYAQIGREFQLAPPVTIHASDPALLAGYWHAVREAYVVGPKGRAMREAVASAVSTLNACPYCVTVHTGMFAAAGGGDLAADSDLPPHIQAAQVWAKATLSPDSTTLGTPEVAEADLPQVFATAVMFHYTNRMVSLFLDDSPMPLPGMASRLGTKATTAALSVMGRRIAGYAAAPGEAIVKAAAELPEAFAWARDAPHVAAGLAHFARAARDAGLESVPVPVRDLVGAHLARWNGAAAPLSRGWIEQAVAPLAGNQRAAARLALLTARAPWQVDDALIADFRRTAPSDRALVQTTAWAAFAAAHRIATWFPR